MSAIEEVLWNIFTSYTLNGNPKDPSRLNGSGLLKFCRDIMVLDPMMTEVPLAKSALDLIYTSEIKSPKKVRNAQAEKSDKLDFDQFLSALIKIALKCYPSAKTKDEAMQQLLMDNILPLAARRKPFNISTFMKQPPVEALLRYYEAALSDMFRFYSATSDQTLKGKNMIKATSNIVKTFDDQIDLIEESKVKSHQQNAVKDCIGYSDFMRFCNDFSMTTSLGVTSLHIGDIYLSVLASNSFSPTLRKIDFREFWECIVRCALVAFQDSEKITTENKVKALFHYIWRNTQSRTQDHMLGYGTLGGGGFNTYRGGLLKGTQLLNERFVQAWTKDDYRDYLDVTGHSVLATAADKHRKSQEAAAAAAVIAENTRSNKPASSSSSGNTASGGSSSSGGGHTVKPPMGPPPAIAVAAASAAPAPVSLMHKLLSGAHKTAASGGSSSSSSSAGRERSPTLRREDRPSSSTSNIWVSEGDRVSVSGSDAGGKMTSDLLHDDIERRENFTVRAADGQTVQVMIRDEDHIGDADGRINSLDLRRLLHKRPDIAVILYDCIVEEGIMDPFEFEAQDADEAEVDGIVDGMMSPAGGRSRTSSKVAFSDLGRENDGDEREEWEKKRDSRREGAEQEEGDAGEGEGAGGEISMAELDDLVDGMVEESEEVAGNEPPEEGEGEVNEDEEEEEE